jgi:hypothetical protein
MLFISWRLTIDIPLPEMFISLSKTSDPMSISEGGVGFLPRGEKSAFNTPCPVIFFVIIRWDDTSLAGDFKDIDEGIQNHI